MNVETPDFLDYVAYGWYAVWTALVSVVLFLLFTLLLPITIPLFIIGKVRYKHANLCNDQT